MEYKDMDICLFRPWNWFGILVAWVTNSKYSHAGIIYDGKNKLLTEARMDVVFVQLKKKRKHDVFRYKKGLTKKQIEKGKAYLSEMAGKDYDLPNLIDILINMFRSAFGRPYKRYFGSNDLPICSELVTNTFKAMGIDLFPDKPSWAVTPEDLSKHPDLEKIKTP